MKKINERRGITLVALVITVILLLILAGISIQTLTNQGLFSQAQKAKQKSKEATQNQATILGTYEQEINKYIAEELTSDKINTVLSKTKNTVLKDTKGNLFTVPAGFKIVSDATTSNATTVDKGIVVEDATVDSEGKATATNGSQFVWVPLGTITKADGSTTTINLDRYTFDESGNETAQGEKVVDTYFSETASKGNTIAKSITDFKTSVATNGGYYIGRYEARKNATTGKLTEVKTDTVWNEITQPNAATQAQNMYDNTNPFTSDLINSYAWDTAILFIQNCTNTKYSRQTPVSSSFSSTGTTVDVKCNIYDMASNVYEFTTETSNRSDHPCVYRGGSFNSASNYTSIRYNYSNFVNYNSLGFRPILYL